MTDAPSEMAGRFLFVLLLFRGLYPVRRHLSRVTCVLRFQARWATLHEPVAGFRRCPAALR